MSKSIYNNNFQFNYLFVILLFMLIVDILDWFCMLDNDKLKKFLFIYFEDVLLFFENKFEQFLLFLLLLLLLLFVKLDALINAIIYNIFVYDIFIIVFWII
jgi:hypothetical protein